MDSPIYALPYTSEVYINSGSLEQNPLIHVAIHSARMQLAHGLKAAMFTWFSESRMT